jgi:hypothetical protein
MLMSSKQLLLDIASLQYCQVTDNFGGKVLLPLWYINCTRN